VYIGFIRNGTMLSLENIVLSRGGRKIIGGISVKADRGNVIALLGPNGTGKTTLLHFIAGVLKGDSGAIYCEQNKVDPTSLDWRRRLSYVLDDGGVIPLLTVEEQLYLQCVLVGVNHVESIERTRFIIDLLQLDRYRDYRGDELSAGLRKRLGIGIGIARDADVFLFDEPFSSLDVQATSILGQILITLRKRGRIVIVASHSFPFLHNVCNHIWSLSAGIVTVHSDEQELRNLLDKTFRPESSGSEEIDIPWILEST
jgi:ABC-type multidrug transport system ATPase subunit